MPNFLFVIALPANGSRPSICEGGVYCDDAATRGADDYSGNDFARAHADAAAYNRDFAKWGGRYEVRDNLDGVDTSDADVLESLVAWQLNAIGTTPLNVLPPVVDAIGDYVTRDGRRASVHDIAPVRVADATEFRVKGVIFSPTDGPRRKRRFTIWHVSGRALPLRESGADIVGRWPAGVSLDKPALPARADMTPSDFPPAVARVDVAKPATAAAPPVLIVNTTRACYWSLGDGLGYAATTADVDALGVGSLGTIKPSLAALMDAKGEQPGLIARFCDIDGMARKVPLPTPNAARIA